MTHFFLGSLPMAQSVTIIFHLFEQSPLKLRVNKMLAMVSQVSAIEFSILQCGRVWLAAMAPGGNALGSDDARSRRGSNGSHLTVHHSSTLILTFHPYT